MGFVKRTGQFFFVWRDKLPVPLVLAMAGCARPRLLNWLVGLPLILLGEALRIWALMHIGPKTRTRSICAERLITSGPYSHCRNPLYLANFTKILGFMVISGKAVFAAVVAMFYLLEFSTMIPYEEGFLAEQFPDAHKCYREVVPAFLPTLNANSRFDAAPNFTLPEALRSEKRTFASTSLILLLVAVAAAFRKEKSA
ncbi:MAG: isoprenylcysteine carboxylmethyltransferase family protein [Candidatus Riflebacteria bacterium]|nr:isoprenylcysteine carboxylmethyltransferase family protein [Candidatus Riflebacteria bacterium]